MAPTRREFLVAGLGLAAGLSLGEAESWAVNSDTATGGAKSDGNILVVINLDGGNDGLNTVVPYRQKAYLKRRSQKLAVGSRRAIPLTDNAALAFNPAMAEMADLYGKGKVAVLPSVGIPGSDSTAGLSRSHVRAAEIWATAQPDIIGDTGWLGRYIDSSGTRGSAFCEISSAPGLGGPETPGALIGNKENRVITCTTPGFSNSLENVFQGLVLSNALASGAVENRVYHVTLGGFDTHADQAGRHEALLEKLSLGLSSFLNTLERVYPNLASKVLVLVQSEFGRRLDENESGGTDHGSAGLCLVAGQAVRGGVFGSYGDLNIPTRGDYPATVDFRTVYATILDRWLGADSAKILGGQFGSLDFC